MAVISAIKKWSTRQADRGDSGLSVTDVWQVLTDDPDDDQFVVLGSALLPAYGDVHPQESQLFARSIVPVAQGPTYWLVTVVYRTLDDGSGSIDDPLNEAAELSYDESAVEEPVDVDINGNPLVNSAGESFSPSITRPFADDVLTIVKNRPTNDNDIIRPRWYTVNNATFKGEAPGTCLLAGASRRRVDDIGITPYWTITLKVHIRFDGWTRRILDEGFREIFEVEGPPPDPPEPVMYLTITDQDGNPVNRPALLDGSGKRLPEGDPPFIHQFELFEAADWSPINYT